MADEKKDPPLPRGAWNDAAAREEALQAAKNRLDQDTGAGTPGSSEPMPPEDFDAVEIYGGPPDLGDDGAALTAPLYGGPDGEGWSDDDPPPTPPKRVSPAAAYGAPPVRRPSPSREVGTTTIYGGPPFRDRPAPMPAYGGPPLQVRAVPVLVGALLGAALGFGVTGRASMAIAGFVAGALGSLGLLRLRG